MNPFLLVGVVVAWFVLRKPEPVTPAAPAEPPPAEPPPVTVHVTPPPGSTGSTGPTAPATPGSDEGPPAGSAAPPTGSVTARAEGVAAPVPGPIVIGDREVAVGESISGVDAYGARRSGVVSRYDRVAGRVWVPHPSGGERELFAPYSRRSYR